MWKVPSGMPLVAFHAYPALVGIAVAGNVILAVWAFAADLRRRHVMSAIFWTMLLVLVALVAVQVASGVVLAVGDSRPQAPLHFLYGILVAIGAAMQFGLRPGGFLRRSSLREPRALALICLTQAALLARAYTTGAFGR